MWEKAEEKIFISVHGDSNLYTVHKSAEDHLVLKSLEDAPRYVLRYFSNSHMNKLNDMGVFIESAEDQVKTTSLLSVFCKIKETQKGEPISKAIIQSKNQVLKFFEKILPEYNKRTVELHHMKQIYKWYNILLKHSAI